MLASQTARSRRWSAPELPLADAKRAHELVLEPGAKGKIVLLVAVTYLTARASSSSITVWNCSNGCAPTTGRPLMYIVGVELHAELLAELDVRGDRRRRTCPDRGTDRTSRYRAPAPPRAASGRHLHARLIGEDPIVHLPVLALLARAVRGLGAPSAPARGWAAGSP